ncbi:glycosyltransferase [Psittacicella gerlachiana]|uniref:Fucosyltransferase C-terminal domain-containing protein n=1 Tax=Psittacicella gerlachiana TaxID=2028574 RepID=A0A3A1YKW0_9GAMM|nr:glycosyltransferase family 10 [Psittacicella gerlachiana]RIY37858.1 hypothetical protein CKF59_01375 [Psittacicella gerlachiana]
MKSTINYCGFWGGFDLEKEKFIALYHKFNYQKLPYNTYIIQGFLERFWTQGELERCLSTYEQRYNLATHVFAGFPLSPNGKRAKPLPTMHQMRSVYHAQEHIFEFDFCLNAVDNYVDYVDLALGPYLPQVMPSLYNNYLHVPNYFRSISLGLHTLYGLPTFKQVEAWIEQLEQARLESNFTQRKALALCVARHDKIGHMPGVRGKICDLITQAFADLVEHPVFYPSKFRFNTHDLKERYQDDKIAYGKNFWFMVCPENSYAPGYVSEKLFEAMASGCIPIYWGGIETELDYINPQAFIYFDPRNPQALTQRLLELWHSPQKLQELRSQPYFLPGAAARIFLRYIYPVAKRWSELMGGVNLYAYLREPQDTSLEAEKTLAQASLDFLGLSETKYSYLEQPQNRPPYDFNVDFSAYSAEQMQILQGYLEKYQH